ncbi:hypothetical protein F5Y19DRAFT_227159 [Xylariaceae sp. FL1651]|nr:hypothetical protein F5Y19DRAFT_227159 [Xylariaceae sp. FL1651]
MPLSREPSQRALNWVRWNSSKTSLNSTNNSKRVAEPEIIHLGGSRVGTAFEELELPAPDRSKPTERPLTQWAFNPPPPKPPGIGIAIASPDDSPNGTLTVPELDSERPITQWFQTEWQPGGEIIRNRSDDRALRTAYPYPSSNADTAEERLLSPLTSGSLSSSSTTSPAIISPFPSSVSSPTNTPETNSSRPALFPKRSTSLSQASRHAPPRVPKRAVEEGSQPELKEIQLRRTQSNAEFQKPISWRASPPRPVAENKGDQQPRDSSPQSPKNHEAQRSTRSPPKAGNQIQDPQVLPPLTSAPPNMPLPPISGPKLAGLGKTRDQLHQRGRSSSSDRSKEKSPPREHSEQRDGQQQDTKQKLTSQERFWLHRHYRGEAMFLRAWGLQISSEEDREEGRKILRDLMEGEAREERERESQERQRMHHRSGSASRCSTATSSSGRDGIGLDVIAEERHSREIPFRPRKENFDYVENTDSQFWKTEPEANDRRLVMPIASSSAKRPGLEQHSRTESESSVLEAYLDLRLSQHSSS